MGNRRQPMGDGRQPMSNRQLVARDIAGTIGPILTFIRGSHHNIQDRFLPKLTLIDFLVHIKPPRSDCHSGNIGEHQY